MHPWFQESRARRDNSKADWYVWADAKPDGTPPNNWLSVFGGAAWQWNARRRQYHLHNFLRDQPDLLGCLVTVLRPDLWFQPPGNWEPGERHSLRPIVTTLGAMGDLSILSFLEDLRRELGRFSDAAEREEVGVVCG